MNTHTKFADAKTAFTIGHSTRSVEDLIQLLSENSVIRVVDIRTIPRSRHNPQFNADVLPETLGKAGLSYELMPGLGGLRRSHANSPNSGWRNASFRGFADYMQTAEFNKNLELLISLVQKETVSMMCAEAVPWRCHRSLIADALTIRGIKVEHIIGHNNRRNHVLTPWARVKDNQISYPPPDITDTSS